MLEESNLLGRRTFLGTMAGVAASGFVSTAQGETAKPNILFVMTDQQRADTIAALGNSGIYTPNMDRL
ncbi:MAG TPA: sulfatase, partial [Candidatus Hydrogenedentes bacterium]|nr:sulfatase [Candidatus Hydrogenedentota bacterium]